MIVSEDRWSLRLGSCLDEWEGMPALDDDSVDVTIMDPPYENEAHNKRRRTKGVSGADIKRRGGYAAAKASGAVVNVEETLDFAPITEHERIETGFHVARVTKRWALAFCQIEAAPAWRSAMEASKRLEYVRTMIWIKPDGQPQFTGDRPGQGYEAIVLCHRTDVKKRWNGKGRLGVFQYSKHHGAEPGEAPHPTTKPPSLMEDLVQLFADPDELVLDPFAGSGSTGLACIKHGRRFDGWELAPKYFEIAVRRMRGQRVRPKLAQPELFEGT
jgi:site-specific DNA-methyltransferase (adenine-specific)